MLVTDKEEEILFQNRKIYYKGVIEDNNDPEQMARYKVRVLGVHSQDKVLAPTATLPWATSINSLAFGFDNGIGISSIAQVGTWVWCIFDNGDVNAPVIVGAIVAKGDINTLASGSKYTLNNVIQTKAGHIIEIDDDPANNRINIKHSSGTYLLIKSNGDIEVNAINNTTFNTTGITNINSTGAANITSSAAVTVNGKDVTVNASGSGTFKSAGAMLIQGSAVTIHGTSTMVV
jgi:hypothetical protein